MKEISRRHIKHLNIKKISETERVIQKMKNILSIMENMGDIIPQFPVVLDEPHIYLSRSQTDTCKRNDKLKNLVLPDWVSLRLVVDTLKDGQDGIHHEVEYMGHKPWLWSTEFENVHMTWNFEEPRLTIDDKEYKDSETYRVKRGHQPGQECSTGEEIEVITELNEGSTRTRGIN
jgi:hypothetical protein